MTEPNYLAVALIVVGVISILMDKRRIQKERDQAQAELARWRYAWSETDRWLAEFPDVECALFHLKSTAEGDGGTNITKTRETMRLRRDGKVQP